MRHPRRPRRSVPAAVALLTGALGACTAPAAAPDAPAAPTPRTFSFGPFDLAPGEEQAQTCVQLTLDNEEALYINQVELTAGPGFHHSNWLFVPEHVFAGEDGVFDCEARGYSEAVAAVFGGVLFAQSTQAPHEVQAFPAGVAIKLPRRTKLVAQLHLLNATDAPLHVAPTIALTPIAEAAVATRLAGMSFQNQALGLPPGRASRFTVECDLAPRHQEIFGRAPDFRIYYALAHYHELGRGMTIEAVRPDGTAATIYTTANSVGDSLGGPLTPPFDMTGFTKLRFACDFYNPRAEIVRWGVGDQEMCVFLAFSDSTYVWGGGVNERDAPASETEIDGVMHYTNPCQVLATDAER